MRTIKGRGPKKSKGNGVKIFSHDDGQTYQLCHDDGPNSLYALRIAGDSGSCKAEIAEATNADGGKVHIKGNVIGPGATPITFKLKEPGRFAFLCKVSRYHDPAEKMVMI